jgi:hypothetical protein
MPCYRIGIYSSATLSDALKNPHPSFIELWKSIVQHPNLRLEPRSNVTGLTDKIIMRANLPFHYFNGPHYTYSPTRPVESDGEESDSELARYFDRTFYFCYPTYLFVRPSEMSQPKSDLLELPPAEAPVLKNDEHHTQSSTIHDLWTASSRKDSSRVPSTQHDGGAAKQQIVIVVSSPPSDILQPDARPSEPSSSNPTAAVHADLSGSTAINMTHAASELFQENDPAVVPPFLLAYA